jgi:hypothetical protein
MYETEDLHVCTLRLTASSNGRNGPVNQGCVTTKTSNNIKRITERMPLP